MAERDILPVIQALRTDPWFDLALAVAELKDRGIGLHEDAAFSLVAVATGASARTVQRAWAMYKDSIQG